jgi:hypothetical protein
MSLSVQPPEELGLSLNNREGRERLFHARTRGELVDFSDIVKQFQETAAKMPELDGSKRMREMAQRRVNIMTPAISMTPEEIKARRERELAEIKRMEEAG